MRHKEQRLTTGRFGTFNDLLELTPERLRPVAIALRETIVRPHPGAALRHVRVRNLQGAAQEGLSGLVAASLAERRAALGI